MRTTVDMPPEDRAAKVREIRERLNKISSEYFGLSGDGEIARFFEDVSKRVAGEEWALRPAEPAPVARPADSESQTTGRTATDEATATGATRSSVATEVSTGVVNAVIGTPLTASAETATRFGRRRRSRTCRLCFASTKGRETFDDYGYLLKTGPLSEPIFRTRTSR